MNKTFKNAIIISMSVHAAIILPLCTAPFMKEPAKKELVVDYVRLKEALKLKTPVTDVELKVPESPKVELKPKVEAAPAPRAPTDKVEAKKDATQELAQKQQRIRTTKDYVNYYQLLREKIRQKVKRNYTDSYGEGEIHLNFVLSANGSLASCEVDRAISAGDAELSGLAELAVSSVRQASPFPPFPKALEIPAMNFSVTVVFKKERS
jgi:protein TonB